MRLYREVGNGFDVTNFQVQGDAPEVRVDAYRMLIGLKALDTALAFYAGVTVCG